MQALRSRAAQKNLEGTSAQDPGGFPQLRDTQSAQRDAPRHGSHMSPARVWVVYLDSEPRHLWRRTDSRGGTHQHLSFQTSRVGKFLTAAGPSSRRWRDLSWKPVRPVGGELSRSLAEASSIMVLNPNASAFSFNAGAAEFVPTFGALPPPHPQSLNIPPFSSKDACTPIRLEGGSTTTACCPRKIEFQIVRPVPVSDSSRRDV